jgi:hypothetical protein
MKWCAPMLLAAVAIAGSPVKTFVGMVHDNRCVGPACATKCPVNKSPVYTLQSGEDAYILATSKPPASFVGRKVIITGTVEGNKIKVNSITPAR